MLRTGYAVNATSLDGRVSFLDGFRTSQRAQDVAEYIAGQPEVRRVSWGEVRDGGYYATASALCAER